MSRTPTTEVTCIGCQERFEIPSHYADLTPKICSRCVRDRAESRQLDDDQQLLRLADDGGPAEVMATSGEQWCNDDFPKHTAASDDAPAEARDGSHVAEAGSRHGSRDADELPVEGAPLTSSAPAIEVAAVELQRATIAQAGTGSSPVSALLSSSEAGACTHHAPADFGMLIGAGGDLSSLPVRSLDVDAPAHRRGRGPIFSNDLIAPTTADWLQLWRAFTFGRLAS